MTDDRWLLFVHPLISLCLKHSWARSRYRRTTGTGHFELSVMASVLSEEQFTCCICLDLFRQPVSIPCGHNFCLLCIQGFWDTAGRSECPLCKETFRRRPELRINHALTDITEGFKRSLRVKSDQARGQEPSQGDRGRQERPLPRRQNVCGRHRQPLDIYCKTEQIIVCLKCAESQHKGHQTVLTERESNRIRTELREVESKLQRMVLDRLEKMDEIKHSVQQSERSMENEIEESMQIFTDLLHSIERRQVELVEELKEKQREVARRAASLSEELEKEIAEIVMKKSEVEQLVNTQDQLYLLQNFRSVVTLPRTKDWSQTCISTNQRVGIVRRAMATLEETLRNHERKLCEAELHQIQQYAVDISFDPQTAAPWLVFSSDLKQASLGYQPSTTPSSPSPLQFDSCVCVLGQPGISSGRHYWVVQVGDKTDWELGVARESINRKGAISVRPDQGFWAVCRRKGGNLIACAGPATPLVSCHERPQNVGVFVDYEGGLVSFYDVADRSHIYSYTGCSFAERLYPYFNPCLHDDGKNTAPLIICPLGGGEVAISGLNRRTERLPPLIRHQSSQGFISQQTPL
ncbi:hypothetical protein AOLI_G00193900 [Acnodon oligacanthus]